jgi:hypothetical protein
MSTSRDYSRAVWPTTLFVIAWFAIALAHALFNRANPDIAIGQSPLIVLAFVVVPIVAFIIADRAAPAFRALVHAVDLRWIVLVQAGRVFGIAFVLYESWGWLPAGFALPAGWGDVAIGLAAPFLVIAMMARAAGTRTAFLIWSALGVADLLVAVTLGLLHSSTAFGLLRGPVAMDPITWFPLSLIPSFGVPAYLILHAIALMRVREVPSAATRAVPA